MVLNPWPFLREYEKYGVEGAVLSLTIAFVEATILFIVFHYLIYQYFELSGILEILSWGLMVIIYLVIYLFLHRLFVTKK